MHDIIAFFQIGEINVERGTRRQRVRRFLAARPLNFVTPKNFRIGDNDEFRFVANKAASERADLQLKDFFLVRKAVFFPDFHESLPLAVVVAENMNGIILPQPAVKLLEKFAPLRLGNLWFGRALGQRTKRVERIKFRIANFGFRIIR